MAVATPSSARSYLVPIAGPALAPMELLAKPGGLVAGRNADCEVFLDAETVSRVHVRFDHDGSRWHVADLGSRWGTFVNGVKLTPQADTLLSEGDLLRITPWTMTFSATGRRRGLQATEDSGRTIVRSVSSEQGRPLADTLLALLLESAGGIHAAASEKALGEMLIDSATRGTGLQNAALLRPTDAAGGLEIISSHFVGHDSPDSPSISFSRSLINAASNGSVAEISASAGPRDISQSMVQLNISSAICVPLMLGGAVAAYLYLDSRGSMVSGARTGATTFCAALGKIASLALANLKRLEMEKRDIAMRAELDAAATAQRWIMPKRLGSFGPFQMIGESRPGQFVGGDFFDVIPLGDRKIALAVGDVSGKGISASVLMTATQGYLHASLKQCQDPGIALSAVNRFINPRRPENKFVTAWVAVIDGDAGTLRYVDAGHSYAVIKRRDGTMEQLNAGGGLPLGVDEEIDYQAETIPISAGDEVMVVSDGIVEQFGMVQLESGISREQFEVAGMMRAFGDVTARDEVAHLFEAVVAHAGTSQLSDDATAVLVKWT